MKFNCRSDCLTTEHLQQLKVFRGEFLTLLDFFTDIDYSSFVLEDEKLIPANKDQFWDILFIPNESLEDFSEFID